MPDAGIAVRPARNGAQMIDQMAKTGSETVEQAPLRLANPARLFSIRNSQSCDLGGKIGKDRAVAPARLERSTGEQLPAIPDDERNREGRRTDPAPRLAPAPSPHTQKRNHVVRGQGGPVQVYSRS